ncbi:sensor histidine kinase [Rhodovibrio salinarum]|uniref:histidine kinase n=1 Tax=Rhodovibrio salinarum TaxID=1087 RepID=A0A934QLW1_9PROT|nr:PAS domain-containing sensor histidine kinase [Rhodovibrio salinarum]MBK1699049.1 PAS domain-containing sensor histidine kinase [Rhodovibrio salinarum]
MAAGPISTGLADTAPAHTQAAYTQPARDETAALRAELARTRARLDDISRLVSDWIWEVDRNARIVSVSPRVMAALGYHPMELVGRPFTEVIGLELPITASHPDGPVHARPFRDREVQITNHCGQPRSFRLSGLPVFCQTTGRFEGYRGTAQDVTELRAREAALLEAKNTAEEANRTKSDFLAQMSHELRTPLNAILGFSEIMQSEALGPIGTPQYKGYIADIATSAQHLSQMINDVLDVAKLEAGKFQIYEDVVNPAELIDRALRIVTPRARDAGVELTKPQIPAGITLLADEQKLLQVLLNLLSNAIKFTPSGGHVSLKAEVDGTGAYGLSITDTGIGMSAKDQEVALSPFGQVDSSLSRRYEGTGLGLPLSKALVELHGGRLEIDSAPEAGTSVRVTLPIGRVEAAA